MKVHHAVNYNAFIWVLNKPARLMQFKDCLVFTLCSADDYTTKKMAPSATGIDNSTWSQSE